MRWKHISSKIYNCFIWYDFLKTYILSKTQPPYESDPPCAQSEFRMVQFDLICLNMLPPTGLSSIPQETLHMSPTSRPLSLNMFFYILSQLASPVKYNLLQILDIQLLFDASVIFSCNMRAELCEGWRVPSSGQWCCRHFKRLKVELLLKWKL